MTAMSTKQDKQPSGTDEQPRLNPEKDPRDWTTGGEPMTGAQASYLHTLAEQQGEEVPELRHATGAAGSDASTGEGAGIDNTRKDPSQWVTGDEPMTGAQASYLKTLSHEAGDAFDPNLTKAEASKRIDALQAKTGRGQNA
jgi:hypothetical protein